VSLATVGDDPHGVKAAQKPLHRRFYFVWVAFPLLLVAMFFRLGYVQFFHPRDLGGRAANQSNLIIKIPPYRGRILDHAGAAFAIDIQLDSLGAHSKYIKDPDALAANLHKILGGDPKVLRERLRKKKEFVWLHRLMTPAQSGQVKALKRKDLELRREWKRIYPNKSAASQIVGFTGIDHEGLEGVEKYFDSYLKGVPGWRLTQKDAKQRELVSRETDWVLPVDGYDIYLTLDNMIQHIAEKHLEETCKKYNAIGGSVTVMEPKTGNILALANYPTYDPNNLKSVNLNSVRNRAITDIYEPGSVFKIFTVAAVLEENAADLNTPFFCEQGTWRVGGRVLHDVHPYGTLTLEGVVQKSSNIGTVKAAAKIGPMKLNEYIRKFGFGERSGLPISGESPGLVTNPKNYSATSMSSVPIGQEIGMTAIQLATAVSAIANDGMLTKPLIVSRIESPDGQVMKRFESADRHRVISESTARKVRQAMEKVVGEGGTGKLAAISGAKVGGKTGTSQKLDENGRYSHSDFISSFVGYVEKDGRIVTITVSIDNPKPVYYGGVVAAPLFSKVGRDILDYWQLSEPIEPKKGKASVAKAAPKSAPRSVAQPASNAGGR